MALIPCPECSREISDKAAACPHCGNPMRTPARAPQSAPVQVATAPGRVVTTQATDKHWKGMQIAGVCLMGAGVAACNEISKDGTYAFWMTGFWLLGILVYIGGRFGAWWHHS